MGFMDIIFLTGIPGPAKRKISQVTGLVVGTALIGVPMISPWVTSVLGSPFDLRLFQASLGMVAGYFLLLQFEWLRRGGTRGGY